MRLLTSTIGAALNSLVTMSRSPSPSRSKIADDREPRAPQIATRPVAPAASRCPLSLPVGVELEERRDDAALPRLDAEHELGVDESLAAIVQHHRVDHVAVGIVHAGGDEDVVEAVGVEVADARSPRPVVLDADRVGDLGVLARPVLAGRSELPQMLVLPLPRNASGHFMSDFIFSRSGPVGSLMSECMSVMKRSSRPSLL